MPATIGSACASHDLATSMPWAVPAAPAGTRPRNRGRPTLDGGRARASQRDAATPAGRRAGRAVARLRTDRS